jgi:hypothetical protein
VKGVTPMKWLHALSIEILCGSRLARQQLYIANLLKLKIQALLFSLAFLL